MLTVARGKPGRKENAGSIEKLKIVDRTFSDYFRKAPFSFTVPESLCMLGDFLSELQISENGFRFRNV